MATNEQILERQARRAYELGRLRSSLRFAPIVLAAIAAALASGRPLAFVSAVGIALLAIAIGLSSRGGALARAVMPGLGAGVAAIAIPLLMATVGHACFGPACLKLGLPACIVGGALAGAMIGKVLAREPDPGVAAATIAIAALMGSLGCTIAGAAGVVGMLAGAVGAGAPVIVLARR